MEAARAVIDGYCSVIELKAEELEVLFPLACGRLAVTICMASARRQTQDSGPRARRDTTALVVLLEGFATKRLARRAFELSSRMAG